MQLGTHQSPKSSEAEIQHGIELFSKPVNLCQLLEAEIPGNGWADIDHDGLTNERPEDDVVRDEDEVQVAFLVTRVILRGARHLMGNKEQRRKRIGLSFGDVRGEYLPVRVE